ncbi:hybrid sensor histidine kinase/response regulator [Siansivirga zeaxanthinifaciens]|uniref:histidine kinase n=1 Tax=Siansivirga zeaxanthinifaciens CC-SAMT-1 TaxID=1454006 RepID=A0A0C5WA16_9FLAO|nr:hybrid sensor histidine kinase/response regulator [Siansivirga zeaxanthinifaciens]AJR03152.1 ATP-binding protein [Siansivirga zeaxanthinifaciens CC-SAMT-1]
MKLLLILISLFANDINYTDTYYNPELNQDDLFQYASYTNVGKQTLNINEVLISNDLIYTPLKSDNESVGFTSDYYWVRFKLENTSAESKIYYLNTARPVTDFATLYQITNNNIKSFKSGDEIRFEEKQVKHRSTIFKIILPPNSKNQFYLNLKSDGETINIPLNIYNENEFWKYNYNQQLFFGLFYGILLLAGIIYLFFYKSLKEKTFLFYGFYVFSIASLQAALDGLIFQYIFPNGGYFNTKAVLITALFSNLFLLKYCEYFLKIKVEFPLAYKGFRILYFIIAGLFVMVLISPQTMEHAYPLSNLNGLLSLILIIVSLFYIQYKGVKIDRYFSIGIFFLVIGLMGFVMNNLSLLPNNFYVVNSAKFGAGFEVIFLSLSMTNLIKKLRLEKEKSQEFALIKSEEISQLKTYFMSNISHELRTPINAIMGIAELQLNDEQNKETRKQFEIIKNASLSLLSNVNDILDFELIEKNELILKKETFNPETVLSQINNNWKIEAENKGLIYNYTIDNQLPYLISGDTERFLQIINNVVSNAFKYTKEGSIQFKITSKIESNESGVFDIVISDTGIGIDNKILNNIYDSFSQMRLNHKRQFGGIGLGLSIVKHLVKLFNGTINIKSELGVGTQVNIKLPFEIVQIKQHITADATLLNTNNKDLKILIVEDNKMNQMVIRKILQSFNYTNLVIANNGNEGLECLKKESFDIILMDLQMPVMDGYEATKIIRNGDLGELIKSIPIIAVTADAMQKTREYVLEIGMNDYINKPINKATLYEKINLYTCA